MKVCARCFTEMKDKVNACPNCRMVVEDPKAAKRPRLPFGIKVTGEAPVGAEVFRGFAVTELKTGDEFRETNDAESGDTIQLFRGSKRIWLWLGGSWEKRFVCCDVPSDTDDWIEVFAASHGFEVKTRTKENRRTGECEKCWRLK